MLTFKKSALSVLVLTLSTSASTGVFASDADFTNWLKSQKEVQTESVDNYSDQLIVKYKSNFTTSAIAFDDNKIAQRINKISTHVGSHIRLLKRLIHGEHVLKLDEAKSPKALRALIKKMKQEDDQIESLEIDPKRYLMSQSVPWGISNVQADQLSDSDADAKTVCIIDTGYDVSHEDLANNKTNGSNDSGTGNWYHDGSAHGSHVAGTIAGINNEQGVVGVLPNNNINLHIVKVFDNTGLWGYSSELADAINTCVSAGADVINMSLGGEESSDVEEAALQAAADRNVLLIAAAGNDGDDTYSYPATYPSVVSVGALDETNEVAGFSQYNDAVELSAPGVAVLSTVPGNGRLGKISIGSEIWYNEEGVVPQGRYTITDGNYLSNNVNGSVTGDIGTCDVDNDGSYSCADMTDKICLVERYENQLSGAYPEINNGIEDCMAANASGVIVYSNDQRPGLQSPFLVDENAVADVPVVSVNQEVGRNLASHLGESATLTVSGDQDYAYYNGTSMATPHVTGVAALVWSNAPECTADDIRNALASTALDINAEGKDNYTGYGLIQAADAVDYLGSDCAGNTQGTPKKAPDSLSEKFISVSKKSWVYYELNVPANASNLTVTTSRGLGDVDLYVNHDAQPGLNTYQCRSYQEGNDESCSINNPSKGTWYIGVYGYKFSIAVSLEANSK